MKHTLIAGAVLASLLLGACATSSPPPQALIDARTTIRTAELDPAVLTHAPLELKKAAASLSRANQLQDKGEPVADVTSAAYIASQQAKTAMAIAKAKGNDAAIAGAELDRERTRADIRTAEAQRAQAQASTARAQTNVARQQTANAEQRASGAEAQAAAARLSAGDAQRQSAQLQQMLTDLQAKQTERGMLVTLGDVLFEFNRAEVKPGAQASLRKLADFLAQNPSRRILIEGHTDSVGTAAANTALSRRRADAVDAALEGMGLAGQRVTTVGYGEDYPVADNTTETNRALNRRVEVYIAENDQPVKQRR
jgi:outer membrane protein OmpA-like peptidoglycan-associated protein